MSEKRNEFFEMQHQIRKGERQKNIIRSGKYTLSDAAYIWMQSQKHDWKPGTYTVYHQILSKYILPNLGNIKITKITNQTMDDFIYHQLQVGTKKLSKNYMSQISGVIRRILIYMNKKYQCNISIPYNPVTKRHSHQIILPSENALTILEEYLFKHSEQDTCLGILIAYHTGIRIGELSALTWKDIHLDEGMIYIRKNLLRIKEETLPEIPIKRRTQIIEQTPKTSDSIRIIPIPPGLFSFLQKYKKEDSAYIISGCKNPWAEPRTIQYRFKSILKKCNIDYFNFHMLRHAFASRCVAMGLDIKSLSEILGHSNIQITLNLYVHSTLQQKKHLMQQYDSLLHSRL